MGSPAAASDPSKLGDLAAAAGVRRVHILAWRDLDDVEAGGSELHAAEIAARWAAAGLEVVMRTSHAQGGRPEIQRDGYRVVRRRGRHLVFLDAPLQEMAREGGRRDALLEVWNGMPFLAPLWARGPRATFIHHVHVDMWAQVLSPALARVGQTIEQRLAPPIYRRTRILTPSESSKADIVRRLGLPASHITAIPNGVSDQFTPGGERAERPTILTVGRLVPHKRVDRLVAAAAEARERIPGLELIVVGEGHERPAIEAAVRAAGAVDWVHLLGHVSDDDLVDLYRQAWVLASASSAEGWGMTITEAGACGTPAVATPVPGHVDVIDHERTGLLAEPDGLADALVRVLGGDTLRASLGAAAQQRADALSWDHTAVEVLRGVLGSRG